MVCLFEIQQWLVKGPLHYNELTGRSLNEVQKYEKSADKSDERDHQGLI